MARAEPFDRVLRRLDGGSFVDFVAALWRARGWHASVDGSTLVVTRDSTGERRELFVDRRGRWIDSAPVDAPERAVDAVVTRRQDPARPAAVAHARGADLIDSAALYDLLNYGVDPDRKELLLRDYLGRSSEEISRPGTVGRPPRFGRWSQLAVGALALAALVVGVALLAPGAGDVADAGPATDGAPETARRGGQTDRETATARPPGLNASGVADPFALARAHQQKLSSRSYTVRVDRTVATPNATLRNLTIVVRVTPGASVYHYVLTASANGSFPLLAPAPRLEFWYDGERTLVRYVREDGNVSFAKDTTPGVGGPVQDPTDSQRIVAMFRAFPSVEIVRENDTTGGRPRYRLRSTNLSNPDVLTAGGFQAWPVRGRPHDASLAVRVDADGVVHSYRVSYEARHENRTVRVTRRVTYTGVGSTAVERPDWFAEANATD